MTPDDDLVALAETVGLMPRHTRMDGTRQTVSAASLQSILQALGYSTDQPDHTLASLRAERAARAVAPVVASFEPDAPRLAVDAQALQGDTLEWSLTGNDHAHEGRCVLGELERGNGQHGLPLPALTPGYYRVTLRAAGNETECLFIRAPAKAWAPESPERGWGFAIQLYEQVGPHSIGMGDFTDLAGLGEASARMGATTLGTNPLHALFLSDPKRASPYSPNSRLALNPLYLDVRRLPGVTESLYQRLASPAWVAGVKALNAQAQIDYARTAECKQDVAREAFRHFRAAGGDPAFAGFCREAPAGIEDWTAFETIAAEHGGDFRRWPASLQSRDHREVARYLSAHADTLDFHRWLQWQADTQLGEAVARSRLALGLYQDLALGADPGGAEIWAGDGQYVHGLGIGAPPDPLNPAGQSWGLPPLHPSRLCEHGLAPFIRLIRANMRHAGAIRVDHVLGLNRLFVIPDGCGADDGAYLRYPLDLLLAVLALESHRAHCLVVGEDLGTVPPGFRERLAERGIFSLRLLYFERDSHGQPRNPEAYPRNALTAVGSHDLPPLAGWWHDDDLARNDRLGLWPDRKQADAARTTRTAQRAALAEAFDHAADGMDETIAIGAYRRLARTPSRLLAVQPEDALGIEAPVNVPGTTDEEPNWRRRRLPPWPEWLADPRLLAVWRVVDAERGTDRQPAQRDAVATYRLQLHGGFGFGDAATVVPYLARLGISHLYLSPVLASVPGSSHGYDMCDPTRLDADRGGDAGFAALADAADAHGLALVLDFVPNHMAAHPTNPWWMDVLEWGRASPHAAAFDIDWSQHHGRVLRPILGAPLQDTLTRDELDVEPQADGRWCVGYYEHRLPLASATIAGCLRLAAFRTRDQSLTTLARRMRTLPRFADAARRAEGLRCQAELAGLLRDRTRRDALTAAARTLTRHRTHLRRLLDVQHWQLADWHVGPTHINYRRFFDIDDLVALQMQQPGVFAAAHVGVRRLLGHRAVAGLRLDHIDGLARPGTYLHALRDLVQAHGGRAPLWIEKILGADEALCPWPVAGTTGYEVLNDITRLFVTGEGARGLRGLWQRIDPEAPAFAELLASAKREVIDASFPAMLERTARALASDAPVGFEPLRNATREFAVAFPVYRDYADLDAATRAAHAPRIRQALDAVRDEAARDWLARTLETAANDSETLADPVREGVARLWQLAASAMAKGLEDTAFYRDFALLALNEVGGDPRIPTRENADFHARMTRRARDWPASLNAGATHDTKRGEDARLRLAMLAGESGQWAELVPRLRAASASVGAHDLHPADACLTWQTLLAIWPPPATQALRGKMREQLTQRLQAYLVKALREGKQRSSWIEPDERYEKTVSDYAAALLDPAASARFQRLFLPFAGRIAQCGARASLAALTLRCTVPGIPDIYQGTEDWDLSLVDPDNRRAVNYTTRERALDECTARGNAEALIRRLLRSWPDGRIKAFVLTRLLHLRQRDPQLFNRGDYVPMAITGAKEKALAFRRELQERSVVTVIARVNPARRNDGHHTLAATAWGDARVDLPAAGDWRELFTGRRFPGHHLDLRDALDLLPAAVLIPADAPAR